METRVETKEIVLCPTCNGSGQTSYEECVDYHKRDYETIYETCKRCDGTGRLKKITVVTLEKLTPRS